MRREAMYRGWIVCACVASIVSGAALWMAGERPFGAFGIAAGVFHALWGLDLRALVRGRWRRRPIVIPTLRPIVVLPPHRSLAQRLRAWRARRDAVKHAAVKHG
ncbi:MAG: hypothetical protein E6Q50_10540 [Lysobacter sp.]|mgnify:CR=1 FL=1|jgi:hypothetical protein|nr:MAG: hypothetical protein E6Q50_10540 [Lysobacter sp.]